MQLPQRFGPYVLLSKLGAGAFGDVFLARPAIPGTGLPEPIVVKRLHFELNSDARAVQRFTHEAEIATKIDDPHVVKVYDVGRVDDLLYLAMEYVAGWPLDRVLTAARGGEPPPIEAAARIVDGALRGLEALHRSKVVHRDIAPKNLMIGEDGRTRLIDLGIGKSSFRDWKTATGMVLGSPGYMSPEQVTGDTVDHRTDLFAIGVVLYEILTLQPYIQKGSVSEMLRRTIGEQSRGPRGVRDDLPKAIDDFVLRCVELDPAGRFQSAGEARRALERAVPRLESGARSLKPLLGPILLDEVGRSKTQVAELLSLIAPPDVTQAHVVLAQRHLSSPHVATVSEMPSMPVVRPRRRLPSWMIITASVLTAGVLGVEYGRWSASRPKAPVAVEEEVVAEETQPIVTQRKVEAWRKRPKPERKRVDPPRLQPPGPPIPRPVEAAPAPAPIARTPLERLAALQNAAVRHAESLPKTHPRRKDWDKLVNAITVAKLKPEDDGAAELEASFARLLRP